MLIVTTESIPGYAVRSVIGEVHGIRARERNVYAEGIESANNGEPNPRREASLSHFRDEAIAALGRQAATRGANAVLGMRFDHRDIVGGWIEICAYGTAVYVVPTGQRVAASRPERSAAADRVDRATPGPARPGRRWLNTGRRR